MLCTCIVVISLAALFKTKADALQALTVVREYLNGTGDPEASWAQLTQCEPLTAIESWAQVLNEQPWHDSF